MQQALPSSPEDPINQPSGEFERSEHQSSSSPPKRAHTMIAQIARAQARIIHLSIANYLSPSKIVARRNICRFRGLGRRGAGVSGHRVGARWNWRWR